MNNTNGENGLGKLEDVSAACMLLTAITDFAVDRKDSRFVSEYLKISEKSVSFIFGMPAMFTSMLIDYLNNRQVVTIDIDYERALTVATEVKSYKDNPAAILTAATKFEERFNQGSFAEQHYKIQMNMHLSHYITKAVSDAGNVSSKGVTNIIPAKLLSAMSDMSLIQKNIFYKGCFLHRVVKLNVDAKTLDHCINGFKVRADALQFCLELVKRGAHFHFVNKYNGSIAVEHSKIQEWRKLLQVDNAKQTMSHKEVTELWTAYNELFKSTPDSNTKICDIYFSLHRKFKSKYRIETLYNRIQSSIEAMSELDDEDEDEDEDELINLLR